MRDTERGIGRKRSRLLTRSLMWDSISGLQDHDLSQRKTHNQNHPGTKIIEFLN